MTTFDLLNANGLTLGRMITDSKSQYVNNNPHSVCCFNANICTANDGKIWFGDLDITKDAETLKAIAETSNEIIYVLRESDARFGSENVDPVILMQKSIWNTNEEIPFK